MIGEDTQSQPLASMSACMGVTTSSLDTQKETRSDSRVTVINGSYHRDPGLKAHIDHLKGIAKDMALARHTHRQQRQSSHHYVLSLFL